MKRTLHKLNTHNNLDSSDEEESEEEDNLVINYTNDGINSRNDEDKKCGPSDDGNKMIPVIRKMTVLKEGCKTRRTYQTVCAYKKW